MKKVSIVILNWNGQALLEKFLPSVTRYTHPSLAEIVVADNASTDQSIDFIKSQYPDIRIIILSENLGFAEGYNQALRQVDAEYYVLLNSDVEVTEGWLLPTLHYMEQHSDVAAVQPKILSQKDKSFFEYAGAAGGFIDKYGYPFCRGRIFSTAEKDNGQYNNPEPIFWATGACLVIRATDFQAVGGFDATFFAHMEEIDLCWRLNARGRKIYCLTQSTVYHVGGATLSEESPQKTYLNFRNNILMLYKNLPNRKFNKVYRIRIVLDYLAALQMFVSRKKRNAQSILQAHKEFKKIKVAYEVVREDNLKKQTQKKISTIYPKSILFEYYLKGKKKFSQLIW